MVIMTVDTVKKEMPICPLCETNEFVEEAGIPGYYSCLHDGETFPHSQKYFKVEEEVEYNPTKRRTNHAKR